MPADTSIVSPCLKEIVVRVDRASSPENSTAHTGHTSNARAEIGIRMTEKERSRILPPLESGCRAAQSNV